MIAFGVLKRLRRKRLWSVLLSDKLPLDTYAVRYLAREGTYALRGGMKRAPVFMEVRTLVGHGSGVVRTRKVSTLPQSLRANNFTIINYIHSTI